MTPYFVLGTPRSRTAWLAAFLSTPDRACRHEPSRRLRTEDDLWEMLTAPHAAVSDSGLTLRWRDITKACPGARVVVVRRPALEVQRSLAVLGFHGAYVPRLLLRIEREIWCLMRDVPALLVPYRALRRQAVCELVYAFCHGTAPALGHWEEWAPRNVQADLQATLADVAANAAGVARLFPELVA